MRLSQASQPATDIAREDFLDDACIACATLPRVLEPLQAIVPICCSITIDEEELKGVSPHYEITTPACSQLSALHRARSGSDHAHHNHSGYGLHDVDNQAETENKDHHQGDHVLDFDERDGIEDRNHFEDFDSSACCQVGFDC